MTFTKKLVVFGISLSVVPLVAVGAVSWRVGQQSTAAAESKEGTVQLARSDLDHVVSVAYLAADNLNRVMTARGARSGPDIDVIEHFLDQLKDIKIGQTGYVYILQASGAQRGAYVLSLNRKRDGEILWDARDGDDKPFIQSIISAALTQGPNDMGEKRYPWKNANDPAPVMKVVRFKYFAPWDWVIAAGIPEPELFATARAVQDLNRQATVMIGIVTLVALVLSSFAWVIFGRRLTRRIGPMVENLSDGAHHMAAASTHVSESSQTLAHGASEQAASIETTSASMEQLTTITRSNADSTQEVADLMADVGDRVRRSNEALHGMVASMGEIQDSSQRVAKIIKTIDEIAFQTNILALNAAVEAARAGEAGMGFAVVADEVRNLAQRSAKAAHDTAALIEESIARAQTGVQRVESVELAISGIGDSVTRVKALVDQVNATSHQQTDGLGQLARALTEISNVTHTTAATAEESAAASQELAAQADTAMHTVDALSQLIGAEPPAPPSATTHRSAGATTLARAAVFALVASAFATTASAQTPLQFKTEDGATTLKVGTLVQGMVTRDTGGVAPVDDVYLRRVRLVAGGQVQKRLKFFIESDTPFLGRKAGVWQRPETIVQDAFVTYEFSPRLMVDAGLMLVSNSYNSTQSAASLLPIGYGAYSFLASAPTSSRIGRVF